jgi:hypothetical protein
MDGLYRSVRWRRRPSRRLTGTEAGPTHHGETLPAETLIKSAPLCERRNPRSGPRICVRGAVVG